MKTPKCTEKCRNKICFSEFAEQVSIEERRTIHERQIQIITGEIACHGAITEYDSMGKFCGAELILPLAPESTPYELVSLFITPVKSLTDIPGYKYHC